MFRLLLAGSYTMGTLPNSLMSATLHRRVIMSLGSPPLRPLLTSSSQRPELHNTSGNRPSRSSRNEPRDARVDVRTGTGAATSPADVVIFLEYVDRVVLPEYESYPCGEGRVAAPGAEMNEEPPPYDAVEEHMDLPAPPAYSDLFPDQT